MHRVLESKAWGYSARRASRAGGSEHGEPGLFRLERHAPDLMIHNEREVPQDIHAQQAFAPIGARKLSEDDRQIRHTESLNLQATDSNGRQAACATRCLHVDPGGWCVSLIAQAGGGP